MVFKFFVYLALFYIIIRFLRGLFQTNVIIKNYHYQQKPDDNRHEGDIKIIKGKTNTPPKSDNLGEYVEYEDVK